MDRRAKIATAVGGSVFGHLLLLGGAVGWIALGGAPDNDDFSLRTQLGDAQNLSATGSNFAASRESGEPLHAGLESQSGSIWWQWTAPPGAGRVLVETELQGGGALLGIYTGFAVNQLQEIAHSSDGAVNFDATAGTDYHIAIAGNGQDAEGPIKLRLSAFTNDTPEESPPPEEIPLLLPDVAIEERAPDLNYVRTTQNDRETNSPRDPAFQSDRNTTAASEIAPDEAGIANMPSQEGEDLPFLEMADRDDVDGEIADDATIAIAAVEIVEPFDAPLDPLVKPLEPAQPTATVEPSKPTVADEGSPRPALVADTALDPELASTERGDFAAETTGEPNPEGVENRAVEEVPPELPDEREGEKLVAENQAPEAEPDQPEDPAEPSPQAAELAASSPGSESAEEPNVFQPQTRRNKVAGTISNRGKTAVDAAETPLGRYTRQVTGAVERRWHSERRRKADRISFGNLKITFAVTASGKPGSLRILENNADPLMVDFTLGAILTAEIPPVPEDVLKILGGEPLEITYDVIIY